MRKLLHGRESGKIKLTWKPNAGERVNRDIFIQQELYQPADLSKGTYSASRIKPAA